MIPLGIFAKPPHAGLVKTRLIADIGAEMAAKVYRFCLEHTLEVAHRSCLDYTIFLTQACTDDLFRDEQYALQQGGDLGARMQQAFENLLATGADGALITGSDCLDINAGHLLQASQALADHDLVLLPALDGGYALIGCRTIEPTLFTKVHWSSDKVLAQTIANAGDLNYRVRLLETVRDVDTLQDLEHYPELLGLISSS